MFFDTSRQLDSCELLARIQVVKRRCQISIIPIFPQISFNYFQKIPFKYIQLNLNDFNTQKKTIVSMYYVYLLLAWGKTKTNSVKK
jgi:hypothetical protein